ncbi:CPBP family intramembrane glutamic endopeptidase [Haloquadratum walsbyi]|uniref:Abi/CAAX domain protein n=1 Tax=Haloquadratum walsbyi (strain DSM 16854 / JCM 12705 / C23) TaxID=768065 RepID=G0LGE6_HALWC|nr:CPBP family intramembrane glutamic endopeptidase [Haloquadratum walsbyi]CCC39166.1 Abi/CAAX domain protein [Haloquadratum walsbyi C23]
MPQWATFVGFTFIITAGLLVLSHASRGAINTTSDMDASTIAGDITQNQTEDSEPRSHSYQDYVAEELSEPVITATHTESDSNAEQNNESDTNDTVGPTQSSTKTTDHIVPSGDTAITDVKHADDEHESYQTRLSTIALLANVTISQGLFAMLLISGAWIARIPVSAFGVGMGPTKALILALGVGTGVILYIGNEVGSGLGAHFGVDNGETLRSALAPETSRGWVVLLFVVLPIIAGFEELLFRGALIGVIATGYNVSPWILAVVSSLAFALGHGAQGRIGIAVTGVFGFVLAAVFVLSNSLLIVIIAHYIVNALEFIVHEGFDIELYSMSDT